MPLGFDTANTVTARIALPAARYREPDVVSDAYRRVLEQLRALNGVSRVGASTNVPLLGGTGVDASFAIEGRTFPEGALPSPQVRLVTDGYFEAIGMTLVRGRSFGSADMQKGAASVVVINERLAASVWPGEDRVGKRLSGWTITVAGMARGRRDDRGSSTGGRAWWAHCEFARINIAPPILRKKWKTVWTSDLPSGTTEWGMSWMSPRLLDGAPDSLGNAWCTDKGTLFASTSFTGTSGLTITNGTAGGPKVVPTHTASTLSALGRMITRRMSATSV